MFTAYLFSGVNGSLGCVKGESRAAVLAELDQFYYTLASPDNGRDFGSVQVAYRPGAKRRIAALARQKVTA